MPLPAHLSAVGRRGDDGRPSIATVSLRGLWSPVHDEHRSDAVTESCCPRHEAAHAAEWELAHLSKRLPPFSSTPSVSTFMAVA